VGELRVVVAQWQRTHVALQQGDPTLGLPGHNSPEVTRLFAQIAPDFNAMLDAATNLLLVIDSRPPVPLASTPPLTKALTPYVQKILAAEPGFVTGMDAIVAQYQSEADQRVSRLQLIEWTVLAILLADVVLLVVIVFRPATRYVGQAVADLVRAQEREHELAALKDQFIIDANHELRTPIMALYNNLEVLAALGERGTSDQRVRILQRALSAGDAVIRLLTSVLDTSALEGKPPRLDLKAVELVPVVRSVLETFDPREIGDPGLQASEFQTRPVNIYIPPELVVWADEGRLRQILTNLLANGIKYSPSGSPIVVSAIQRPASRGERRQSQASEAGAPVPVELIQVSIRDRGLGVPPRDVPKLFNRFVRLERDIAGPVRGTGVGLYLCRVLVEAMGGRIWVESSGVPGEGSTFSFLIPAAPQAPTPRVVRAPASGRLRSLRPS
jgi:signal transduction histidine kinase